LRDVDKAQDQNRLQPELLMHMKSDTAEIIESLKMENMAMLVILKFSTVGGGL
jgi:hypothetical protein